MKSLFDKLHRLFAEAWWVEISTVVPDCIYYFGPFESKHEAAQARAGYVIDLEQEGAQLLRVSVVLRQTPTQLTVESPGQ